MMTASKIFLCFCLSFILGIFLNSFFIFSLVLILFFLILGILLISIPPFSKRKGLVILGFCILFLSTGIYRQGIAELKAINNELRKYNDLEESIILIGEVIKEPDVRDSNTKLTVRIKEGKVLITTRRYPQYQYGDKLEIKGKLESPKVFEDFNYKDYLAKDKIYSVMYYPAIKKIGGDPSSPNLGGGRVSAFAFSKILGFKNKLRESIFQNLSPPQSSILGAIILGDKRQISEQWKEKLNITGTRHITCVSGMHIIILAGILMWLGMALGLWRGQAFYFAIIFLILFIVMVGAPPSAIRAGIMGGLFLLAEKIGRMRSADRALVFVAALMLFQNPLLLKLDVGFQLSFLATLGIIYLMPIFQDWFNRPSFALQNLGELGKNSIDFIKNILAMTLSAQVFTLPIIIYNFGYMSLVSPITNILIVPLVPFIMIFGFISGLLGIVWQTLGWIFSWPVWFLLTYITKVIDFFSQLPFVYLTIENISWLWLLIAYLILAIITWHLNEKQKLKFLEY
ncbi:ComEC/Rec2 family competence protein [Candidatus Parcubacteria bacterium]|nr:ComEC/Rec2 family competence protein [Candidatus Parcubacteria bacterium]